MPKLLRPDIVSLQGENTSTLAFKKTKENIRKLRVSVSTFPVCKTSRSRPKLALFDLRAHLRACSRSNDMKLFIYRNSTRNFEEKLEKHENMSIQKKENFENSKKRKSECSKICGVNVTTGPRHR